MPGVVLPTDAFSYDAFLHHEIWAPPPPISLSRQGDILHGLAETILKAGKHAVTYLGCGPACSLEEVILEAVLTAGLLRQCMGPERRAPNKSRFI